MNLETAIEVALLGHRGQTDKSGEAYILHPLRVMESVGHGDPELQMIAVMHDVVEDTHLDLAALERYGFSERVLAGVDAMSRRKEETYNAYIDRLCLSYDACLVKMHDIADNTKLRRLPPHEWKWFASMQERYLKTQTKIEAAITRHICKSGPGAGVEIRAPYTPA